MRRRELKFALREASRITRDTHFIIIGSQAVHAYCDRPPAEVTLSQECDIYPRNKPETSTFLAGELGRRSRFARQQGFYVDVVDPTLATLPKGWQRRLRRFDARPVTAWCLEVHDLLISKLAAGRLKDLEFVGALIKMGLAKPRTVRTRIQQLTTTTGQEQVRARLRLLLDSLA